MGYPEQPSQTGTALGGHSMASDECESLVSQPTDSMPHKIFELKFDFDPLYPANPAEGGTAPVRPASVFDIHIVPVDSIPNEILESIFEFDRVSVIDESRSILHSMRLSQVSRRWHDVATHLSSLWTEFYFSDTNSRYNLLPALIERSRGRPLNITLATRKHGDLDENMLSLLESLTTYIHRWRCFTISTVSPCQMTTLMDVIADVPASHLEVLSLNPGEREFTDEMEETQIIFALGAPRLLSLRVDEFVPVLPTLPALTHIHLSYLDPLYGHDQRFRELLLGSPCLEELVITHCIFSLQQPGQGNVHLPRLRSLCIMDMEGSDTTALLRFIFAPRLDSMTLHYALNFDYMDIAQVREGLVGCGPYPDLHVFNCHQSRFDEVVHPDLLFGMPLVERVTINSSGADFLIHSLMLNPSMWAHLQKLSVSGYSRNLLRALVAARADRAFLQTSS